MMLFRNLAITGASALALTACATVNEPAGTPQAPQAPVTSPATPSLSVTNGIERYMAQRAHVESVGFRLRRAAAPECQALNRARPDLGIVVWSLANFPNAEDQQRLQNAYSLTDKVTVAIAVEGAPASRAGLARGDIITAVNGQPMAPGAGGTERFISTSNQAAKQGPVTLELASGKSLTIQPDLICEYPTLLVRSPDTNAAADGAAIAITTGLFEVARSDDELALILGHELAHNTLGHMNAGTSSTTRSGKLLDALFRSSISTALMGQASAPYSPAKEQEADYQGLYFMARAGFSVAAADTMWSRLNKAPGASKLTLTHPSGPERQAALKRAADEIRAKQKSGAPLVPDLTPHQ